jgi:hypothetical protein
MEGLNGFDLHWCRSVLESLIQMPLSEPFFSSSPTCDIGLSTIQERPDTGWYEHVPHFLADLHQIRIQTAAPVPKNRLLQAMASNIWNVVVSSYSTKSRSAAEEWFKEPTRTVAWMRELVNLARPDGDGSAATDIIGHGGSLEGIREL